MLLSKIPSYFKARREQVMKANPNAIFVLPSHPDFIRNSDVNHPYRQDSNFFYLSGFDEPESVLVLAPAPSVPQGYKTVLFVRRRDKEKEMWEGERYGTEGAMAVFGADEAFPIDEFDKKIQEYLKTAEKVFYRIGLHESWDRRVLSALDGFRASQGRTGRGLLPIFDPQEVLGEMRLFKRPEEIETLRKVSGITAKAYTAGMKAARPGMNEAEVEALMDYTFRQNGCQRVGFGSIVAGGVNATCLHYRFNNQPLKDGDLLLIDTGGELDYYSSDVTRTFPVGKKFTPAQGRLYDLVLKAQKEAIAMCRPGAKLPDIHRRAADVILDGCLSLGLLKGNREELVKSNAHSRFFPHRTSHFLGMDVHDVGLYQLNGEPRALAPGMVFTIEPGFYVQPSDVEVPAEYKDIGIRIEDDIVITDKGCENLTQACPKEREEIEALKASQA